MTDAEKKLADEKRVNDIEMSAARWARAKEDLGRASERLAEMTVRAATYQEEISNAAVTLGNAQAGEIVAREKFHALIGYVDIPF